ncbi:kinase/pyrophosphorylase [Rhodobacteraceae bacterium RKSG542]|uniref:pyruvate, water dikinase regulatory protein n=1 Tax=Pseudovibrio flavus TaxID=2529854 RepID=UPI0012BB7358|nr:pyruvate, water dikinase regulatory protein [Pseudovibrio flavus]MTI18478.1 kinase/pyrophosphorylase [Pseudovibrio flavus]
MGKDANYFHLHMISDSTGETLMTVARAASAQYANIEPIEHVYPLIRQERQLERVLQEVESAPGIVLYTLVEQDLAKLLKKRCKELGVPCVGILQPVYDIFHSYLNVSETWRVGGQHVLDDEYFERMEALNFTMMHDDGQMMENLEEADVVLLGISRTSKTPTCIYLANRGIKAANVPIVPEIKLPRGLFKLRKPLVICLVASADRIRDIRQNRVLETMGKTNEVYVDRKSISQEIRACKAMAKENHWPLLDVTRKSIEESSAEIISLLKKHRAEHGARP